MKIFNTLDEILEFTGCDVAIPTNHPLGKYAVFEVVEPYNCKYLDWATEHGILQLEVFVRGKTLIAYLPKYSEIGEKDNMEKYIASYKHLIGCDFKHVNQKGEYIKRADLGMWNIDKCFVSVQDNDNYIYQLNSIKLYLDDETLGSYEEYMQLHYPEYVHVWKHQL